MLPSSGHAADNSAKVRQLAKDGHHISKSNRRGHGEKGQWLNGDAAIAETSLQPMYLPPDLKDPHIK